MQELHGTVPAPAPVQLFPCELPAYRDPAPDAAQLNADITAAEVERALRRAKRGKAAGHDGLSADLLKDAAPALLDMYVHLFNLMLAGDIPDALSMGLITAVHKTSDKCDMANYRSITVTLPLKKVFDSVLECRLTAWTEEHGLRAASQAGFCPDQRTSDQHYVLHTLQDKYCREGGQLHCCFVDFHKAFDTVPRDVLWAVLSSIGVGGRFLSYPQATYSKDCAAVKTADGLSKPFRCHQGVQQGSPLSPALCGIFVDALERLMQRNLGLDVPELDGHAVPLLLYADDLVVISRSAMGLQGLLDTLHQFATYRRLQVSIMKTEVLVFQPRRPALASLPTPHYNRKAQACAGQSANAPLQPQGPEEGPSIQVPWPFTGDTGWIQGGHCTTVCKRTKGCLCCAAPMLSAGHLQLGLHPQAVQCQGAAHLVIRLRGLVWHLLQGHNQAAVG